MTGISYKIQKRFIVFAFLIIPIILLLTFTFYPAVKLVYLGFTDWNGYSADEQWIGWANYVEIFEDPKLFGVFAHHVPYIIIGVIQNIIAILFAVMLNSRIRGRNLFRTVLFLPFIMNFVAVAYMFQYVFDTTEGSLNALLGMLGLDFLQQSWLGNPSTVNYSLASVGLWRFMGYNMVIYLAALQSIPKSMYEAADIDGAGRFQKLWHLTLPSISKIIQLNMFLTISGALAVFELPFVLTNGGPIGASETFVFKTIQVAFQFNNFGLASAMAILLLIMTALVLALQSLVLGKMEDKK